MSDEPLYVSAALFCERAVVEKDEVVSLIRIVDTVFGDLGPGAPPVPSLSVDLTLYLALHAGNDTWSADVKVFHNTPPESSVPPVNTLAQTVTFRPGQGFSLMAKLNGAQLAPGSHVFEVYVGERVISRVPLKVLLTAKPTPPVAT